MGLTPYSANAADSDFQIQNLPFGIFRPKGGAPRGGVAIGYRNLDVAAIAEYLSDHTALSATACKAPRLNDLMQLGPRAWSALRRDLSRLLSTESAEQRDRIVPHLTPMAEAED